MKGLISASLALGASNAFASILSRDTSLPAITIKGNAFFAGSDRFYIRGVDYQAGGSSKLADPLADAAVASCTRDIAEFKKLGINTIRVYSVDNSMGHDKCMTALANAGIYLILDVNSPKYSINQYDPYPSYNDVYLQSVFATIDVFAKYSNTLAFFSGNEVINDNVTSTVSAPYVKAVTRDMKQYIQKQNHRAIPVGYSGADVSDNRYTTAVYMNCGPDNERSDFFAFNDYSWCDPSSYHTSGWDAKVALFANYTIPIFLSEYGCNINKRKFEEVAALYGPDMTPVYSGGLVYEYTQEASNYGLVDLTGGLKELSDFTALQSAFKKTPIPTGTGGYRSDAGGAMTCPGSNPNWLPANDSLPIIPAKAVQYMTNGAGAGPGLTGNHNQGSQTAGTPSTGFAENGTAVSGSAGGSTTSTGAAMALRVPAFSFAPFACAGVLAISTLIGASLL